MLVTIAQFLLSLSILIILHECGHFFPAKWFKTKVEKFFLFFDAGFKIWSIKKGETEYGIGWLPLGGYVKISGMIDESFDKDQMQGEPQPWEFRSKKAWQRLIIMLGGVIVNLVLGFFIFSMLFWSYGSTYVLNNSIPNGIAVDSIGYEIGLRDGDNIKSINGKEFTYFRPGLLRKEVVINEADHLIVVRNGQEKRISIDPSYTEKLSSHANKGFKIFDARMPYLIKSVDQASPAEKSGIKAGDQLIGINGKSTPYFHQFNQEYPHKKSLPFFRRLFSKKDKKGPQTIQVQLLRNKVDTISTAITLNDKNKMGVVFDRINNFAKTETINYGLMAAFSKGFSQSYEFLTDQMKAFGHMFSGKINAKDSLGSFISIGSMFGTTWDWKNFWNMTASLSILLGFLNLLPIPALDGGHVVFLLFEVITGIKPSDKVIEIATMIGFGLLILMMIFAFGLDIWRLF